MARPSKRMHRTVIYMQAGEVTEYGATSSNLAVPFSPKLTLVLAVLEEADRTEQAVVAARCSWSPCSA